MKTYELNGKAYPVSGMVKSQKLGVEVPIVNIPMMSDLKWCRLTLEDRLNHPEKYPEENLPEVIAQIKANIARLEALEEAIA